MQTAEEANWRLHLIHLDQWFLTLGYSGVFELQLPETPASMAGDEGFWELQSKNTWVTQGQEPLLYTTLDGHKGLHRAKRVKQIHK